VESIRQSIQAVLPNLANQGPLGDPNVYTIRQTALDYLPGTVHRYLQIPHAFRDTPPSRGAPTPTQQFLEQLVVMDDSLKKIAQAALSNDMQALSVNGAFLREKFQDQKFLQAVDSPGLLPPG
jgi:hypothetical protein